jgi:hypothetical protein
MTAVADFDADRRHADARAATARPGLRTVAAAALAAVLLAGCGGSEYDPNADVPAPQPQAGAPADGSAPAAAPVVAAPPTPGEEKTAHMATAVVDGKTSAPVDMKYDVLAKPDVGQPFEVELVFLPRIAADTLEVTVTEAPGLVLVGQREARFGPIESGQPYSLKVLVRGDAVGLFYLSATAGIATPVQTEARAFAIPVVIGTPAPAEKPAAQVDAKGQAVQSMPAKE